MYLLLSSFTGIKSFTDAVGSLVSQRNLFTEVPVFIPGSLGTSFFFYEHVLRFLKIEKKILAGVKAVSLYIHIYMY